MTLGVSVSPAPARGCDIVMKGGIASGIVYPPAVLEIARAFRFVNVGGTSAGAIAAALTAAAEYRRQTGGGLAGFERLARVPDELGRDRALLGLFRPNRSTALVFDELASWLATPTFGAIARRVATLPFRSSQRAVAWTALGGGALLAGAELAAAGSGALPGAVATAALTGIAGGAVALYRTVRHAIACTVANGYGLASGVDETDPDDDRVLGVWLGRLLDEVAGLAPADHLTFGHLWYGRPPTANDAPQRPATPEPLINLEMVSTCVSHGRPYTFPTASNVFFFRPEALRRVVHPDVVAMMERNARLPSRPQSLTAEQIAPYVRMPVDRDLPVVLVARMSLAFPVLLTAVELAASAFTERDDADVRAPHATEPLPEPCWFADGGLSSNFPVHLFDAPLPRRPTFAINLGTFAPGETDYVPDDESQNVTMPQSNNAGRVERWSRFASLPGYAGAAFNAIKDWNDTVQMKLPGFRDRIVTVKLRSIEGGLNLDMGPERIAALAARGSAAGKLLVARFAVPSLAAFQKVMDWENHRIVRYRVAMSSAQRFGTAFTQGFRDGQPGDASYDELLAAAMTRALPAYGWREPITRAHARRVTRRAATVSRWLRRRNIDFTDGSPRPQPDLVKRPRY